MRGAPHAHKGLLVATEVATIFPLAVLMSRFLSLLYHTLNRRLAQVSFHLWPGIDSMMPSVHLIPPGPAPLQMVDCTTGTRVPEPVPGCVQAARKAISSQGPPSLSELAQQPRPPR